MTRPAACLSVSLAALALAALSCARPARAPQVTEIVFWESWPTAVVAPIVADFERGHPGLRVRVERFEGEAGAARIRAAVAADSVPDLCQAGAALMPGLLAGGKLADWSAGVADLRPALRGWELCSMGDALYGVPWVLDSRALFYDRTLLERARPGPARPPATWDELDRAAAAVQRRGHGAHGYGLPVADSSMLATQVLSFVAAGGGSVLSPDLRRAVFDSAANVKALQFLLGLRRAGRVASQDALERDFVAGRLAFLMAGPRLVEALRRESPGLRYGVAPVPRPARDTLAGVAWAAGEVLVSFNASKRKHLALDLARFLVEPANALRLAEALQVVGPATVGAETAGYFRARPARAAMVRQLAGARFAPNHPAWAAMQSVIAGEAGLALRDRKSAAQAVRDAQARLVVLVGKR